MKKNDVKYALMTAAAVPAVIAVQMLLSRVFTFHVGEALSRTAMSAVFFYSVIRMGQRRAAD